MVNLNRLFIKYAKITLPEAKNVEQKLTHTWRPIAQIVITHYHLDSHAHNM